MKNAAIFALAVLAVFLAYRLTEVENQRYALTLSMCPGRNGAPVPDLACLRTVQTRTSRAWHLWYALAD
ncbi:hypothetical protein [Methylobacterium sp. A54F]